jgi:hypothetical protein
MPDTPAVMELPSVGDQQCLNYSLWVELSTCNRPLGTVPV